MANVLDYQKQIADLSQQVQYNPSNDVADANQKLQDVSAGKPASYTNQDADRLGGVFNQIMERGPFQYDPSQDRTFQDARKDYQATGQQAAMETTQQVNALGGGYGNTWSGSAGAQQYGEYLKGINDIMPGLEQNAYAGYRSESDRLQQLYETGMNREEAAYGRYRDQLSDWREEREFAANQADKVYDRDYQNYSAQMQQAMTTTGWAREDTQQAQKDAYNWAISLIGKGILPNADILATAGISVEDAKRLAKKHGYGKSSGGGSSGKKSSGSGSASGTTGTTPSKPVSLL